MPDLTPAAPHTEYRGSFSCKYGGTAAPVRGFCALPAKPQPVWTQPAPAADIGLAWEGYGIAFRIDRTGKPYRMGSSGSDGVFVSAVLFDLGNTLVGYYTSDEFPMVLRRCLRECASALGRVEGPGQDGDLFERALLLNRERPDYAVHPLATRLRTLFGTPEGLDEASVQALEAAFMRPVFATARLNPQAIPVLETLRGLGIKTAIVSNAPWGSPAGAWREELARHGLLDRVDATVFCTDVGWRKPHRAPFDRALELLGVAPAEALFVGDDRRWDVVGARNAGIRPVLLGREVPKAAAELSIQDLGSILSLATEGRR